MGFRLPKDVNNLAAAVRSLGEQSNEENDFAVPSLLVDRFGDPLQSDNPLSVRVENQKDVQDVQLTGRIIEYEVDSTFTVPAESNESYRVKMTEAFDAIPLYWGFDVKFANTLASSHPEIEIRQSTGDNATSNSTDNLVIYSGQVARYSAAPSTIEVEAHPLGISIYIKNNDTEDLEVEYLKLWGYRQ